MKHGELVLGGYSGKPSTFDLRFALTAPKLGALV